MDNFEIIHKQLNLLKNYHDLDHYKHIIDKNAFIKQIEYLHNYIDNQHEYYNSIPNHIRTSNTLKVIINNLITRLDNLMYNYKIFQNEINLTHLCDDTSDSNNTVKLKQELSDITYKYNGLKQVITNTSKIIEDEKKIVGSGSNDNICCIL